MRGQTLSFDIDHSSAFTLMGAFGGPFDGVIKKM
jgi:hypothetical protein